MTTRAGLAVCKLAALCAALLFTISALTLSAQAAPIPTHAHGATIQLAPVTAPVPNTRFVGLSQEDLVHLQSHSDTGSVPSRGTVIHEPVHHHLEFNLVRRKGGGGHGHAAPAHAAPAHAAPHPAPAPHGGAPPPQHHHESVGQRIKHAFQRAGHAIAHAAHAVGHFIKTTGAKIAKVGLKIVATVQKVAAKAVGWLPGIGKPLGKIMEAESHGLNKASDAIHAHIGGKLGQAMHRMDKAQKVVGYIPRSYVEEEFEERGLDEVDWEGFVERGLDDEDVYMF